MTFMLNANTHKEGCYRRWSAGLGALPRGGQDPRGHRRHRGAGEDAHVREEVGRKSPAEAGAPGQRVLSSGAPGREPPPAGGADALNCAACEPVWPTVVSRGDRLRSCRHPDDRMRRQEPRHTQRARASEYRPDHHRPRCSPRGPFRDLCRDGDDDGWNDTNGRRRRGPAAIREWPGLMAPVASRADPTGRRR